MSLVSFIGPRPNLLGDRRHRAADAPRGRSSRSSPSRTWRSCATSSSSPAARSSSIELDICYPGRVGRGRHGGRAREPRRARRGRDPAGLQHPHPLRPRRVGRSMLPIPALLATAAVHQHLVEEGLRTRAGLVVETGSAREVHHFALLAGYGAEAIHPVPRVRDAGRHARADARDRPEGVAEALHQGDRQGPLQGDVQDGHLHLPVVLRRADLRGGRPAEGVRRQVLHRHGEQHRGHRPVRGRRGSRAPAPRRLRRRSAARAACSTRAASTRTGSAARSTCGRRTRSPSCSTRRASNCTSTYQEYAALINDQSATLKTLRGLFEFRTGGAHAGAARRGRAREGDRQALRHRRDVPRLDLDRGAHDARRSR